MISKDAYYFYISLTIIHYWLLVDIFIFIQMHCNDRPVGPAAGSQRKSHWPVGPAAGSERVKYRYNIVILFQIKKKCFSLRKKPYFRISILIFS